MTVTKTGSGTTMDCYSNKAAWNTAYSTFTTYNTNNANADLATAFGTYETNVAALIAQAKTDGAVTADYSYLLKAVNAGSSNFRPAYDIGGVSYSEAMRTATDLSTAVNLSGCVMYDGTSKACKTDGATWYTSTWRSYATARAAGAALLGGYSSAFSYATTYTAGTATAASKQADINTALENIATAYNALVTRKLANYGDVNTAATFGKTSFADIKTQADANDTEINSGGIEVKYYDTATGTIKTKTVNKYDDTHINVWNNNYDTTANANLVYYNTNRNSLTLAAAISGYRTVLANLTDAWNNKVATPADYSGLVRYVNLIPTYDVGGTGYTDAVRDSGVKPVNASGKTTGETWYTTATWPTYVTARNAGTTILNGDTTFNPATTYAAPAAPGTAAEQQAAINTAITNLVSAYNALALKKLSDYETTVAAKKLDSAATFSAINSKASTLNTDMTSTSVVYKLPSSLSGSLDKTGTTRTKYTTPSVTNWNTAYGNFANTYKPANHKDESLVTAYASYESYVSGMITAWNNRASQTADYSQLLALVNGTTANNVAWRASYDYGGAQYTALDLGSVNYGDKVTIGGQSKTYGKTWYVVGNSTSGWQLYENKRNEGAKLIRVSGSSSLNTANYDYNNSYVAHNGTTADAQASINTAVEAIFNALKALQLKQMSDFALAANDARNFTYGAETAGNTFSTIANAASLKNAVIGAGTTTVYTVSFNATTGKATVNTTGRTIETIGNTADWYAAYSDFEVIADTDVLADNVSAYLNLVATLKAFDDSADEAADYTELLKLVNRRAPYDIGGSSYTDAMKNATGFTAESGLPSGYKTSGKTWYAATQWNAYATARTNAAALMGNYSSAFNYSTTYAVGTATAVSKQSDINSKLSALATAYNNLLDNPRKLSAYGDVNTSATFGKTSFGDIKSQADTYDADMNVNNIEVVYYKSSTRALDTKTVNKYDTRGTTPTTPRVTRTSSITIPIKIRSIWPRASAATARCWPT